MTLSISWRFPYSCVAKSCAKKNTPASLVEKSFFTPYTALTRLANYRRIGQLLGSLRMVRVSRLV